MIRVANDWLVVHGQEDLELRQELEELAVKKSRRHRIAARHLLDQCLGEPSSVLRFDCRDEPGALEARDVVRDSATAGLHEKSFGRRATSVVVQQLAEGFRGRCSSRSRRSIQDEEALLARAAR